MTKLDVKLVFIDAQYLLRRNWAVQRKGNMYEDGLLRSYFGSINKCQSAFPNAKLIFLFDKKYYDESTNTRYYFSAKAIPEYKSDRVYITDSDVESLKEKLRTEELSDEEKNKLILKITEFEKEANDLKIFNFSKYRILNKSYIDSVDKYHTKYMAFEYPGLEADSLIWILSQNSLKNNIPSVIYSIDSDLVSCTNDCTAFVVPVNTRDSIRKNRVELLKTLKSRASEVNLDRRAVGILSELYFGGHNAITGYSESHDKSIDFNKFCEAITSNPDSIPDGITYSQYYNSLMLTDFDFNEVSSIIDEVFSNVLK